MQRLHAVLVLLFVCAGATVTADRATAEEPVTLIGTIVKWRYPDAEIGEAKMFDAATIDAEGNRTVPSTAMKTTMVTADTVEQVLAFYRDLLKPDAAGKTPFAGRPDEGRSVIFSDESEGRPLEFHTIVVNSGNSSTTLIITRGKEEEKTHITWKQYLKHEVGE
ncbi:hypothetical protein Mal4_39380 [Maioricimonas rarisocia]|uniref:Lipocalin-like domain-containing protein n=1 Tax=Maioricimonas rarisocia TaxID=2528026 RepID=A0A517ZAS7_9PLAN|nr:hypothetical protein [Maioricimonas rarisocia]QDU39592.1 hypothetical protein Mal4_39380 [Maioricimonas rarisocia]